MNKNRLRGVLSHRLFIILLLLLQIAFFGYLVLSGSQDSWLVSLFFLAGEHAGGHPRGQQA